MLNHFKSSEDMDTSYNLGFLIACVCMFCHLPTSEAGCWERPVCNETVQCDKGLVCLESKCHRHKCQRPEQAYLMSKNDVGCDCTDSGFTGDHCECLMPTTPPPPLECESGWLTFERSCYLVSDDAYNWHNSKYLCAKNNASLAIIDSEDEHDFIVKHLPVGKEAMVWIGGSYDDTSKEFKWLSGESVELNLWSPRIAGNARGCMAYSNYNKRWYPSNCSFKYKRICEKQAG